jgi:hypothetical protein
VVWERQLIDMATFHRVVEWEVVKIDRRFLFSKRDGYRISNMAGQIDKEDQ